LGKFTKSVASGWWPVARKRLKGKGVRGKGKAKNRPRLTSIEKGDR
jgi:hypothetical protein